MENKFKSMLNELRLFFESEFKNYFTIIYGSYAYGINTSNSDLDFVTVCKSFTERNLQNNLDFSLSLYERYNLAFDEEVPHERKLLATYKTLDDVIAGKCFERRDERIYVPSIVKTKEFLESDEIVMRLLLNAITSKNIFVSGDKEYYLQKRKEALENMVGFLFSIDRTNSFTTSEFVQSLIGTPERNGEMYLGYEDKPAVRSYLDETFRKEFKKITERGILRCDCERYHLVNSEWLDQLTC